MGVKIRRTDRFKRDYQKLPIQVQQRVDQKLCFLLRDPRHPSLRIHKVRGGRGFVGIQCEYELPGDF